MREGIEEAAPNLDTLWVLDLEYHITGNSKKMCHDQVLLLTPASLQTPTYTMQAEQVPLQVLHTPNKDTPPVKILEMQQISLCWICNIDKISKIPKIWKTISPLSK